MGIKRQFENTLFDFYRWGRQYSAARKRIKEFSGKTSSSDLTKEQEQQIREFYSPYKIPSMVFHRYFTKETGEFHVDYIPQDLYVSYIDPYFNDIIADKYFDNKCYYDALFHGIPQAETVVKRVNSIWLDKDNQTINTTSLDRALCNAGGYSSKRHRSVLEVTA